MDDKSRFECDFFWCLDPIDGTRSYISGKPEYTISLALINNFQPILGIIYNPTTNEYFHAEKNKGAFCNNRQIKVNSKTNYEVCSLAISSSEMNILKSTPKGMFDLLLSNPPYISKKEIPSLMKDVIGFEPASALTDHSDGLTFYKRFSEIAPKIVHNNSLLILEVGLREHPQKVYDIFFNQGYTSIELIKDYNGDDRVMVVQV